MLPDDSNVTSDINPNEMVEPSDMTGLQGGGIIPKNKDWKEEDLRTDLDPKKKDKFKEEEDYLLYQYPNTKHNYSNSFYKYLKELKGTLHSIFGECLDIFNEQAKCVYLLPSPYHSLNNNNRINSLDKDNRINNLDKNINRINNLDNNNLNDKNNLIENIKIITNNYNNSNIQQPMIVTYKILQNYIFLLILPFPKNYTKYGNVMKIVYEQYVNELFEFLNFIYPNIENINEIYNSLDTIFNRFFEMIFNERDFSFINSFEESFVKCQSNYQITQTIANELINLEIVMKENVYNIGSCLIYKGYLQYSHLPKNITKQIIRYLTHFNWLNRLQDSPEMVTIEKVFIKEDNNTFDLLFNKNNNEYNYLLIILAQGEKIITSILYMKINPLPNMEIDNYYISEMRNCLLQLEKKGIFNYIRSQMKIKLTNVKDNFVTQGNYNVLLNYVIHSHANGVILLQLNDQVDISSIFINKCQIIRQVLKSKRNLSNDYIVEHGIHLTNNNNNNNNIGYWICGRMNDKNDEFYIAYEDTIPQDVIELSYRLYSHLYI
ncbi:hypothetical protein ABK040_007461 [Willaertia magna]